MGAIRDSVFSTLFEAGTDPGVKHSSFHLSRLVELGHYYAPLNRSPWWPIELPAPSSQAAHCSKRFVLLVDF